MPLLNYSLTDGAAWQCDSASPWLAVPLTLDGPIGVRTNVFAGISYWIDARNDALVADGLALPLSWYNGKLWDAQPVHGFAIDSGGWGWLASPDSEDGMFSFLMRVDLQTGAVVPTGPMNGLVTGIEIVPEPLWLLAFGLGCIWAAFYCSKRRPS